MDVANVLTVGSLFAGIGGFDLGFERCGMQTLWQVEQNPYCLAVLAKHFPQAQRFEDVCEVGSHNLDPVDLICGGFPCQDLSYAGKGAGIDGARSGLWAEYARIIGELRPRYVVVENVPALLGRGFERVLGDLATLGYDAEWDCLPASAFGAPHRRDRVWLIAYPNGEGESALTFDAGQRTGIMADPQCSGRERREDLQRRGDPERQETFGDQGPEVSSRGSEGGGSQAGPGTSQSWAVEPDVGRVADGVPSRVDRLSALGNALVPQISEWIGRRILEFESALQDRQA